MTLNITDWRFRKHLMNSTWLNWNILACDPKVSSRKVRKRGKVQ